MSIPTFLRAVTAALLLLGVANAQIIEHDKGVPSVRAVVAFMNILDNEAVRAVEESVGTDATTLAAALLDDLEARGIVAEDVSEPMRGALTDEVLGRGAFILFLADLLDGHEPLDTRVVLEAESRIRSLYCSLVIPPGDVVEGREDRVLGARDVSLVIEQFLNAADCILPRLGDGYNTPVM